MPITMTGILYFLRFALPALTLVEQYSLGAADTVNAGRHNSACISRTTERDGAGAVARAIPPNRKAR